MCLAGVEHNCTLPVVLRVVVYFVSLTNANANAFPSPSFNALFFLRADSQCYCKFEVVVAWNSKDPPTITKVIMQLCLM